MKKIITNFLIFIFCSIPRLVKAQMGVDNITVTNEEKSLKHRFLEYIPFIPSNNLRTENFKDIELVLKNEIHTSKVSAIEEIERISIKQIKYAMMLDVDVESLKNTVLYKFIESWFGTRYRMGGTTKRGIDCSAFTDSLLSAVYSLIIPRTAREQYKSCEHISKDDLL